MHQPIDKNTPEEKLVALNFDMIGKAKHKFPGWFNKLFNLVKINGCANLGMYFSTLNLEELEHMTQTFKKLNTGDLEEGKVAILFIMIVMLSQGDGIISSSRVFEKQANVTAMLIATYLAKTERAIAHYDQFDIDYDISRYVSNIKPVDPEVQNVR